MGRVIVASFDAVGGPSKLVKAVDDVFTGGPTDSGVYRIARCGRHSSPSYPEWSKIRWGSEIKEEAGEVLVKHEGRWQTLKRLSPRLTKQDLKSRNRELYGRYELPKTWAFNDFGHITCYFFKDKNYNGKLDGDERIHTEYFHTTPDDEAASAQGQPVVLVESHGCIHLKPKDIDELIAKGYFKAGNRVVVHKYKEKAPALTTDTKGTTPFVVHFYPGAKKVIVTGTAPRAHTR